jgi:hypothetical protein
LWLRYSTLATSIMLLGFFALMVRTYSLGLEINCGCFGPGEQLGKKSLLRDGSLLAFSLAITICAFLSERNRSESANSLPSAASEPQRAN